MADPTQSPGPANILNWFVNTYSDFTDWFLQINFYGLISIVVFYLLILAIGLWAGRRTFQKKKSDTADVFLAGRSIGYIVGSITLTASWVGGGFINGSAEVVATPGSGLVWCQAPVGYAISLVIGGLFFAGRMRAAGYFTMLDPFSERFGNKMGGLLFIPALMAETLWSASILSALGAYSSFEGFFCAVRKLPEPVSIFDSCLKIGSLVVRELLPVRFNAAIQILAIVRMRGGSLRVILGLDHIPSIVVSAVIAVLYTVVGGLKSVAYTDVIQLGLIPIGLWLCFPFALRHEAVTDPFANTDKWLGSLDLAWAPNYAENALLLIFGGIPWQVYFQRVLGMKTAHQARVISVVAGFGCLISVIPAVLIGAVAGTTDWNQTSYTGTVPLESYSLVLPMVLQYLCPIWVSVIGLGAVSAAVMSSTDSSILSVSSMFARNVWKLVLRPRASDREIIWVMRISVIFVGAAAAVMGITVKSVYGLWYLSSDFVYVILFPQLTLVLYNKSVNTYGSICAYIVGLTLRLLGGDPTLGLPPTIIYPWFDEASNTQIFPFRTVAMISSFIVLLSVSYLTKYLFTTGKVSLSYDVCKCYTGRVKEIEFRDLSNAMPPTSDLRYVTRETILKGPVF